MSSRLSTSSTDKVLGNLFFSFGRSIDSHGLEVTTFSTIKYF